MGKKVRENCAFFVALPRLFPLSLLRVSRTFFTQKYTPLSTTTEVEVFLDKRVHETRQTAGANSRRGETKNATDPFIHKSTLLSTTNVILMDIPCLRNAPECTRDEGKEKRLIILPLH